MSRWNLAITLTLVLTAGLAHTAVARRQKSKAPDQTTTAPAPQAASSTYVIQPGDVLEIQVWQEPNISKSVPVRPDGKISLPLLNDVQAAGLTAAALTANLTDGLKKFISDPQVTVIVSQVNSQRFYISGEVNRGGAFPLEPGMTVLQGLSSGGGFTAFANTKKIYVLRQENGKQVKLPFNYKDVLKGKGEGQDIPLQPGDTIIVP